MTESVFQRIRDEAGRHVRRIAIACAAEPRVLEAIDTLRREKLVTPVLIGDAGHISDLARRRGIALRDCEIVNTDRSPPGHYVDVWLERSRSRGETGEEVRLRLSRPAPRAVAMVLAGEADAAITGRQQIDECGLPGVGAPGAAPGLGRIVSSCFIVASAGGSRLFAHPRTVAEPSAVHLAEIALTTARAARRLLGSAPHVAFLSPAAFATMSPRNRHQSVKEVLEDRVWRAAETIRARTDSVAVDRRLWPDTEGGPACGNTWIFAQRHAANLPQMLERQFPGARVLGPIIQGLDLPVNSLPWSSRVDDIVDLAATVVVLAGNGKAPARPGAWI